MFCAKIKPEKETAHEGTTRVSVNPPIGLLFCLTQE